ncbi:Transposon TX1 uncharacterized 149 kDa protein [Vitis vinifera]|uniref:Transposon TX1 uncharacterized 149 kDa protein n=1 Tax=Vitis vinifera TaxID=29760 RepID=A0A438DWU3_VITVI|nr:Transposon TX1 uncharacterized 149 kDa protein [Vitis vinifera]
MAVLVKVRTAAFKKLLQVGKNLEVVAGRVQLVGGTAWRRLWAWSGKMGNCGMPSLLQKAHRVSGLAVGEDGGLGQAQGCGLSFIREEVFGRMVSPLGILVEGDCAVETVPTEMIGRLRLGFQAPMRLSRLKRQEVVEAYVSIRPLNVVLVDRSSTATSSGEERALVVVGEASLEERDNLMRRLECGAEAIEEWTRYGKGGVFVFWDSRVLELNGMEIGHFSISCRFKNIFEREEQSFKIVFSNEKIHGGARKGPFPFRFENMWWKEDDFKDLSKSWWMGFQFKKGLLVSLYLKNLERLRLALRLGTEKRTKSQEAGFGGVQEVGDNGKDLLEIKINETWVKTWVTEECDIKEGVIKVFHSLLSEAKEWRPRCKELQVGVLRGEDAAMLETPFSEEEVFGALSNLNGDKTLGLDGFSMAFWQFSWSFLKEEVMGFFNDFYDWGKFVKSINATFLVLIPKKEGAEDLKDLSPINLLCSLYKLLAKVLANRLKKVVGKIVSKSQNAFVEGRKILNASLIVNEAIDSMQKGGGGGIRLWRFSGRGGVGVQISHLLFANNTLVFCEPSLVQHALIFLLGLPLGARFKDVAVWDEVKERLRKRLSIWKRQYISKGGRLTLIRSTLSMEMEALWRQVMCGKYGEEAGGWRSCDVRVTISLAKEAWVEDVWSHSEGGVWAPRFSRRLNNWEVFDVERFLLGYKKGGFIVMWKIK